MSIPELFKKDIEKAIQILKMEGCSEIYIFGSLNEERGNSADIDIAIKGCPTGRFFKILGRLMLELEHHVDLVNLDSPDPFAHYLEKEGNLSRIA